MMCFLEKLNFSIIGVVRSRLTGVQFTGEVLGSATGTPNNL